MSEDRKNILSPEGAAISIEVDALAEERENAKRNYLHLENEHAYTERLLPYPDVKSYSTAWDTEDIKKLQWEKQQNQPYWAKMDAVKRYLLADDLYSGHIRYNAGGDRYFMESPQLPTKEWEENGRNVILINVDDKVYKTELDAWHYPDQNNAVSFSRNITMAKKQVESVDIVLDRSDNLYGNITDNYLRNALRRNKDKSGIQSIIQTIQRKQDNIRSLPKDMSFIVQGCAGSGKTMVLLHRLRYLIYNKDIYSGEYLFLVPSNGFKQYIKDVAHKFNINYDSIFSYQGYYRYLLGKADSTLVDEASELVFPEKYLERIYSRTFMQEMYQSLFDSLNKQTSSLIEYCDGQLNILLDMETSTIDTAILDAKVAAIASAKQITAPIDAFIHTRIEEYASILTLITELRGVVDEQREFLKDKQFTIDEFILPDDDPRITGDALLQQMNAEIVAEEERAKKASIFTAGSHRKRLQQLTSKRDAHFELLKIKITEEEKKIREAKAAELSVVFGNISIQELEEILTNLVDVYEQAQYVITVEEDKQDNLMDYTATKYHDEIAALNRLIEASTEVDEVAENHVKNLTPATTKILSYISIGATVCSSFAKLIEDGKEREKFRDKYKLFAHRTEREHLAYFNTLLFSACKKQINEEFEIKICNLYKHFWYLSLYCNYLAYGDTSKHRSHIFIDETQDLSSEEIALIYKLNTAELQSTWQLPILNLFGDVNQTITGHGITDWNKLQFPGEQYVLDENFRNTNQIVDYCNTTLSFRMKKVGVDMEEVKIYGNISSSFHDGQIHTGTTFIVKDEYAMEDLRIALDRIAITQCNILTVKASKGLEFKEVCVVDQGMTANERYIAYTRPLVKLVVIKTLPTSTVPRQSKIVQGDDT